MAKRRPRTAEDALQQAAALIAEHYGVAAIVVSGTTAAGRAFPRYIPIGERAAVDALIEAAARKGETAEEAEEDAA